MAAFACVQDIYRCDQCKSAADIHGRGCAHGLMFPVLLVMANQTKCPNYEFDPRKVEEQWRRREEERRNG
ncbi:hypothetical protein [uncultured Alistipes sp.]|uniref:hypothetical protein n=1 Tax=uncultured Alistipes sp. TaxID=538949 RepID=UPI00320AEFA0